MSKVFANTREAVRIKVKKCEINAPTEWRKFSVDPQITSMEVLYSLLAKAFEIKSDFSIKYKAFDPAGNQIYLPVLSDWDLDAAFLQIHNLAIQTSSEACLMLQIDVKPFTNLKEYNDVAANNNQTTLTTARELISPLQQSIGVSQKYMQNKLPGLIISQVEKTFSMMQKAFNMTEESVVSLPPRSPLSDSEFRLFLDALGQIHRSDDLRKVIFFGGIDASLRRVVWKHILNVYPTGMNGHQRMNYMRRKSENYYKLRDSWKAAIKKGSNAEELAFVTSMVKKDVLRTDRLHAFYAGNDDNQNITALFNILTTYALNHPSVSYCQGMSDIASPLLVTMNDEAQAYICFCAVMSRMRGNFMIDGIAMTQKFAHLTEALSYYDPDFWEYLKSQQADDLLFCYRWLLLELKREFPFEDALRMLEVQWSSLKYEKNHDEELILFEKEFTTNEETHSAISSTSSSISSLQSTATHNSPSYLPTKSRESPYTKVCALRRQCSSASLSSLSPTSTQVSFHMGEHFNAKQRLNHSLDEHVSRRQARPQRRAAAKAHKSMDEAKMLQLMESMELQRNHINNSNSSNDNEGDDDVFVNNTPNSAEPNKYFEFLPTNPFKEDAQVMSNMTRQRKKTEKQRKSTQNKDKLTHDEITKQFVGIPSSIAKLQNKNILTNFTTVTDIIAKQMAESGNVNCIKDNTKIISNSGGHFKELKEKIAASRKVQNFEELNNTKQQQKLVKNFNEFLNFSSTMNKSRLFDTTTAITTTKSVTPTTVTTKIINNNNNNNNSDNYNNNNNNNNSAITPKLPVVQLTRDNGNGDDLVSCNSLDDSDSLSLPENSWSGSTAATAIQQYHNSYLSNNSLHLELNCSLNSTTTHTPERSPGRESVRRPQTYDATYLPKDPDAHPSPEIEQKYFAISMPITDELFKAADNLDRKMYVEDPQNAEFEYEKLRKDSVELDELQENKKASTEIPLTSLNPFINESLLLAADEADDEDYDDDEDDHCFIPEVLVPISTAHSNATVAPDELATNATDDMITTKTKNNTTIQKDITTARRENSSNILPPPTEFGGGNPFLMFLCLTLLLQHRNTIMKEAMDYNEIAMYFDKMVRKHDVTRVLNQARRMYIDYLKVQNAYRKQLQKQKQQLNDITQNNNEQNISKIATTTTTTTTTTIN